MAIRLTGFSTPIGGLNWEYLEKAKVRMRDELYPTRKLQVFISSKCGEPKYDNVRKELKDRIQATGLADVYLFEATEASTLTAQSDYLLSLEDSDVCIFLIDNADGVPQGVQNEIDAARKNNIRSLYYFCDEKSKEKTVVEQSLMGAQFSKTKTIHSFSELVQHGVKALVDDIVRIYHYYCSGKIAPVFVGNEDRSELDVVGAEIIQPPTIAKTVIKNVDKCKGYFVRFFVDQSYVLPTGKGIQSSDIDDWGYQFLSVLFDEKPIKQFNTSMFMDVLKNHQEPSFFAITEIRWKAIQAYYSDNVDECIAKLQEALDRAKELKQPSWIIKDILIDLRNIEIEQSNIINTIKEPDAQKELTNSEEEVYYPVLDRINGSLQEKYVDELYREKIKSPYSVTIGSGIQEYCEMFASSYIVSVYYGSLTHIRRIYEKARDFLFFLCSKYDDWDAKRDLLMISVFSGKERDVKGIMNSYPEILTEMKSEDASRIMSFCNNHPLKYKRMISSLLSFGTVGYYLEEKEYEQYEALLIEGITEWLNDDNSSMAIGSYIFPALAGIAYRISQDKLSDICCLFIEKHYIRWYMEMFKFMSQNVDICKMKEEQKTKLIEHILSIFDDDNGREQIRHSSRFLIRLRQQDRTSTQELDEKVKEFFPDFYANEYKLETTDENKKDMPVFIEKYVAQVNQTNATQGVNGHYIGYASSGLSTIRAILVYDQYDYDPALIDSAIKAAIDTLLISKETAIIKMEAVSLLSCIAVLYVPDYSRNRDMYSKLYSKREEIKANDEFILSSNVDELALKISLALLLSFVGFDMSTELLGYLPYLQNDVATTIYTTKFIAEFLALSDTVQFPESINRVLLPNVLMWLNSEYIDIRWNATRILMFMSRFPEYADIVNNQLIRLIDTQSAYIRNLIMRNMRRLEGVTDKTKDYIISKCENDASYVVRMVCNE